VEGWVTVLGYADEDGVPGKNFFGARCAVKDDKVCRPKELPVRMAASDEELYSGSDRFIWRYEFEELEGFLEGDLKWECGKQFYDFSSR
jgi:hypothetical protein